MSTRISYYAETAPRGSRLRRRRRREEKRIRERARLAHHTSPRVIQHTAFVPPAHSSSTRPPSRYVTPQRSTREMSIRAAAPNMGPFTRLVCTNFRTLHTKYAPGPLLPTTDGRSAGGADLYAQSIDSLARSRRFVREQLSSQLQPRPAEFDCRRKRS